MRVGFIGAGNFARKHMETVSQVEGAEMVALWNRTKSRAEEAQSQFGGQVYDDLEEMLDKANLDAVYIGVIPAAHGDLEMKVIERGLPFFVEKPVAVDLETAERIEKAVADNQIITGAGYMWRYFDLVEKTKEIIADKKIVMAQGFWLSTLPGLDWWRKKEFSGGQLIEQATHMFDLARWLVGEPESVHAACTWPPEGAELTGEMASSVNLRYPNGPAVNISCACCLPARYRCGFVVMTQEVIIELMSMASGMENVAMNIITKEGTETIEPEMDPVLEEDRVFLEAVKTGDPSQIRADYQEAVRTLRLSILAYKSERHGHSIPV